MQLLAGGRRRRDRYTPCPSDHYNCAIGLPHPQHSPAPAPGADELRETLGVHATGIGYACGWKRSRASRASQTPGAGPIYAPLADLHQCLPAWSAARLGAATPLMRLTGLPPAGGLPVAKSPSWGAELAWRCPYAADAPGVRGRLRLHRQPACTRDLGDGRRL